jgi:RNA polymerase sigma-70 factor, ECF subfamily
VGCDLDAAVMTPAVSQAAPPRNFGGAALVPSTMRRHAHPTDLALVRATADGDTAAFEALVRRHRPRLVRFAASRSGGDVAQAEDAVQDALVRAHRAILAGKLPADPEAWLFAIVRNRCFDLRRAARPTAELSEELDAGAPSALEVVEHAERLALALDAVGRLPRAQRAALVGRELEGRSYEELAVRQATTVGAIKSLLHRARHALAHGASLPALAPLLARLPRPPADGTAAVAAVTTAALAATGVVGGLHLPGPPAAPTRHQARAALVAAARSPAPPSQTALGTAGPCSTLEAEYADGCAVRPTGGRPRSRP